MTLRGRTANFAVAGLALCLLLIVSAERSGAENNKGKIEISDVFGLKEELAIRATMGVSFVKNRAVMVGSSGLLESVAGKRSNCVLVDGTSMPCAATTTDTESVDGETPAGAINGTNSSFSLSRAPDPKKSLHLFRNGLRLKQGVDYSLSGANVTFLPGGIPQSGDLLIADFSYVSE